MEKENAKKIIVSVGVLATVATAAMIFARSRSRNHQYGGHHHTIHLPLTTSYERGSKKQQQSGPPAPGAGASSTNDHPTAAASFPRNGGGATVEPGDDATTDVAYPVREPFEDLTPREDRVREGNPSGELTDRTNASSTPSDEDQLREHLNRFKFQPISSPTGPSGFVRSADEVEEDRRVQLAYRKGRRSTVIGHSTNLDETRTFQAMKKPKAPEDRKKIFSALTNCYLFTHLDEDELNSLIDTMERYVFHQGEYITRAGEVPDVDRNKLFVILQGEVSVIEDGVVIRLLSQGQCLGESHMMFIQSRHLRSHRVDAPETVCYALEASAYRHIVTRAAVNKRELYGGFLDRVSWLKGLSRREKIQLADCLQPVVYQDGSYLIEYNTLGEWFFLILEGEVDVYGRDKKGEVLYVCSFGVGDCVGELEFINHHRTVADVRAKGRIKVARLHRDHFEMCMGPLVDVLKRTATADERYAYYQSVIRTMRRDTD